MFWLTLKTTRNKMRQMKQEILNLDLMQNRAVEISACTMYTKVVLENNAWVWIGVSPIHVAFKRMSKSNMAAAKTGSTHISPLRRDRNAISSSNNYVFGVGHCISTFYNTVICNRMSKSKIWLRPVWAAAISKIDFHLRRTLF